MVEFEGQSIVVTTVDWHLAGTERHVIQAARRLPVSDNAKREERLAEIEATLVRYGVLRPDMRLLATR